MLTVTALGVGAAETGQGDAVVRTETQRHRIDARRLPASPKLHDHGRIGAASAGPPHLIALADDRVGGHRRARIGALCGQPLEYTTPERIVGVGAASAAEAPAPKAGGSDDHDSPRPIDAGDDRAPVELTRASNDEAADKALKDKFGK